MKQLLTALEKMNVGESVSITILRGGKRIELKLRLDERP